jgi:hypothetical protein
MMYWDNFPYEGSNGGKMAGFGGQDADGLDNGMTAGVYYDTCNQANLFTDDRGPSFRWDWEMRDIVSPPEDTFDMRVYVYDQELATPPTDCSSPRYGRPVLDYSIDYTDSVWYNIKLRVVLNDPYTASNGLIEVFRNDTCILSNTNLQIRKHPDVYLDYWWLQHFAGSIPEARFIGGGVVEDNYKLYTNYDRDAIGVGNVITNYPTSAQPNQGKTWSY